MLYQISSGQGPAECELGVAKLLRWLSENYDITVVDSTPGYYPETYRSARFFTESDLSSFVGSVRWICRSCYRPGHKRKNWFLDFSECGVSPDAPFDESRVVCQTFRSGGRGGQNVNKVESGVRAINLDTGESVVCTEERSQHANKQKALLRLKRLRDAANAEAKSADRKANWRQHTAIQRGGAGLTFTGMDFEPEAGGLKK